ncbi:MAG TPA: trypsin-like serine protease [Minicystis sp.]|nr:trypsin-like serine protease [Minicystis sp.]
MKRIPLVLSLVFASLLLGACAAATGGGAPAAQGDDIVAGKSASSYPEAVLVDLYQGGKLYAYCSGSVIAPTVVLTAGHCVHGVDTWRVTAPYAGHQSANGVRAETYDWNASGETVDPNEHDIGLVFLDAPIQLDAYPALASSALAAGKTIVNVGRIQDGKLSTTALYVSKSIRVSSGASAGFPFDYEAVDEIEPGDSGGPDLLPGAAPHTLVAVNSGAGGGTEVLARVDLVRDWIEGRIAAAGKGSGGSSPPPGGASACAHDPCETGARLKKSCDPCVTAVCDADAYCCAHTWDADCASEVATICGASCGGSAGGGCGDVDAAGDCSGDTLEYCDGGALTSVDCGAYGLSCGFDPYAGQYDCL